VLPTLLIFVVVIGGIYGGWFTPTEAASVGVVMVLGIAIWRRALNADAVVEIFYDVAKATAFIFLVILGADIFGSFLALTRTPALAAELISQSGAGPFTVLIIMVIGYILLGFVMDSLGMILLTIPVYWPIIMAMDYGMGPEELKLWFGIIVLTVVEMGLITPPIGLNVFVIKSIAGKDVTLAEIFRGVAPFLVSDIVRVAVLIAFPILSLALPRFFAS
jgi:C4-dicarboxylate transporter DctM subunit